MKLIIGSVDQILQWSKMLSIVPRTEIMYQVYGVIGSIRTGKIDCEKMISLRGKRHKCAIICIFYEIDRRLPCIADGTLVLCTGKAIGKNKLQVFTVKELNWSDQHVFQRASAVSQWSVKEMLQIQ
ncbi:spermatogenesis-associated protein 22-like [Daktulosphaira vitifoliae]|uniref:spermatogenesis-associated protein 22-like n=1 Tax=Daktulosphaira vitifoliae TaxID=58002 RepID=UPI0021AA1C1E|nr:spermatogenesis-associated protein 22-like [Daktulosphaira vitifoliae]